MGTKEPFLSLKDLGCRRSGRLVFQGLNLDVADGELILLTGPNGSGKSSLLRLLAGLAEPAAGEIICSAGPLSDVGLYIGHQLGLKANFTLFENANFFALSVLGLKISRRDIEKAADYFSLLPLLDRPLRLFSSGQARRAGLMRLFLTKRPLWLLDEPTVGLDKASRQALAHMMADALQAGTNLIVASHDPLGLEGRVFDMAEQAVNDAPPLKAASALLEGLDRAW